MSSNNVVTITKENFDSEVLQSNIPVMVDFWAPWCGPCKMLLPTVDAIADEFVGKVKVCKVNTDEQQELAERFKVMTIPTVFFYKGGVELEKFIGVKTKADVAQILNKII